MSPHTRYHPLDPRHHYKRATGRLGRRGTVLALFGVVWVMQGVTVLIAPESPSYFLISHFTAARAIVWIATGIVAIVYAARPQGDDAPGFLALYVMAAYRIVAYGAGFVLWALPGGGEGNPRGIIGAFSWGVILLSILVMAGWHETGRRRGES